MAEVNQEVAANKPNKPSGLQEVQQCDDVADPATEYMEVGVVGFSGLNMEVCFVGVSGFKWRWVFGGSGLRLKAERVLPGEPREVRVQG